MNIDLIFEIYGYIFFIYIRVISRDIDTMEDVFFELWNSNVVKSDIKSSVNTTHA